MQQEVQTFLQTEIGLDLTPFKEILKQISLKLEGDTLVVSLPKEIRFKGIRRIEFDNDVELRSNGVMSLSGDPALLLNTKSDDGETLGDTVKRLKAGAERLECLKNLITISPTENMQ
jgi:hypothetical protein